MTDDFSINSGLAIQDLDLDFKIKGLRHSLYPDNEIYRITFFDTGTGNQIHQQLVQTNSYGTIDFAEQYDSMADYDWESNDPLPELIGLNIDNPDVAYKLEFVQTEYDWLTPESTENEITQSLNSNRIEQDLGSHENDSETYNEVQLKVIPNPIKTKTRIICNVELFDYSIIDNQGNEIFQSEQGLYKKDIILDLSDFASGVFLLNQLPWKEPLTRRLSKFKIKMKSRILFLVLVSADFLSISQSQNLKFELGLGGSLYSLEYTEQVRINSSSIQTTQLSELFIRPLVYGRVNAQLIGLELGFNQGNTLVFRKPARIYPQAFLYSNLQVFRNRDHGLLLGVAYENVKSYDILFNILEDDIVVNLHGLGVGIGLSFGDFNITVKYLKYFDNNYEVESQYDKALNSYVCQLGYSLKSF